MRTHHGLSKTKLYKVWLAMKNRCYNSKRADWNYYGGKGVTVCDEWRESFLRFAQDMGEPLAGQSLDRIDNAVGYSKANCRWATRLEQNRNQTRNRRVVYRGESLTLGECFERYTKPLGLSETTFRMRLNAGWDLEKALHSPNMKAGKASKK